MRVHAYPFVSRVITAPHSFTHKWALFHCDITVQPPSLDLWDQHLHALTKRSLTDIRFSHDYMALFFLRKIIWKI